MLLPVVLLLAPVGGEGFTFYVDGGVTYLDRGIATPIGRSGSVGGFVTEDVAVLATLSFVSHASVAAYNVEFDTESNGVAPMSSLGFLGPTVQYWVTPDITIGGGLGGCGLLAIDQSAITVGAGPGALVRASVVIWRRSNGAAVLQLGAEGISAMIDKRAMTGGAAFMAVQML